MEKSKEYLDKLTYKVIGAAIEVHRILGPGLLEKVYQKCLARELSLRGIRFKELNKIPFDYKGEYVDLDETVHLSVSANFTQDEQEKDN